MSITAEPTRVIFRVPETYRQTGLSRVAASYAMGRALSSQSERLVLEFGDRNVGEAYQAIDQRGQVFVVNAISSSLGCLRELRAASPYKNDYPDVRTQRERALDELIADAESAEQMLAPVVSAEAASIVATALLWEARAGSIEAADVLASGHVDQLWTEATGEPEVPESILPPNAVTLVV